MQVSVLPLLQSLALMCKSVLARKLALMQLSEGLPVLVEITKFFSSHLWGKTLKIKNMPESVPDLKLAIAT
jgi:hypothetical protein